MTVAEKPAPPHPFAAERAEQYRRDGLVPVSCLVADLLRFVDEVRPDSSLTDLDGMYGAMPEVRTRWVFETGQSEIVTVLVEHRWPAPHRQSLVPDPYRCEHYAPGPKES